MVGNGDLGDLAPDIPRRADVHLEDQVHVLTPDAPLRSPTEDVEAVLGAEFPELAQKKVTTSPASETPLKQLIRQAVADFVRRELS